MNNHIFLKCKKGRYGEMEIDYKVHNKVTIREGKRTRPSSRHNLLQKLLCIPCLLNSVKRLRLVMDGPVKMMAFFPEMFWQSCLATRLWSWGLFFKVARPSVPWPSFRWTAICRRGGGIKSGRVDANIFTFLAYRGCCLNPRETVMFNLQNCSRDFELKCILREKILWNWNKNVFGLIKHRVTLRWRLQHEISGV